MREIDDLDERVSGAEDAEEDGPRRPFPMARTIAVLAVMVALVLLAVVPPLVNVSRYQRRIAASIGASLGRPVRLDTVTLRLLPWPGFEIQNFVVAEDPAFGSEPVMRANAVRATLRLSSLWRRRVEFSRITLIEPSVNLVHLPDGRWNLGSILLQASRIAAAPTAQKKASETPRFPYIEATDARVNLKQGAEKKPFSLTDATFALWLAEPERWQVRLEAHPARTDTSVSDTGTMRLEGTLGRASTLAEVPVDLHSEWTSAPLGAVSWMLLGEDIDVRGSMDLTTSIVGKVGNNAVSARLRLKNARRAEFVPAKALDVDLGCKATAAAVFHALENLQCAWPSGAIHPGMVLTGSVPELRQPGSARTMMWINDVPASLLVDALRAASARTPERLSFEGRLSGKVGYPVEAVTGVRAPGLNELTIADTRLSLADAVPFVHGPVVAQIQADGLQAAAIPLELGGKEPATLAVSAGLEGYTLHLSGTVLRSRLLAFGAAIPQVGDGLAEALPDAGDDKPVTIDLVAERKWGGVQVWTEAAPEKPVVKKKSGRRR
jgi:hypothetical protein